MCMPSYQKVKHNKITENSLLICIRYFRTKWTICALWPGTAKPRPLEPFAIEYRLGCRSLAALCPFRPASPDPKKLSANREPHFNLCKINTLFQSIKAHIKYKIFSGSGLARLPLSSWAPKNMNDSILRWILPLSYLYCAGCAMARLNEVMG